MSINLAPPPLETQVIESAREPFITKVWASWLRSLVDRAQVAAFAVTSLALTAQAASIGLTSLVPLSTGVYRVSYRFRITTAAGVGSSLQLNITDTEGGVVCTQSTAAYVGNVTNAPQSGSFVVHTDPATPLQYETVFASAGAPPAVYELDLRVEQL